MRFSKDAMSVRKNIKTLMKTKIERNIMQKLIRCLALSMIAMGVSTSYASNATQVTGTASLLMQKPNIQWSLYMVSQVFHALEVIH
jgi:choline-glycine betaine transporter